MFLKSNPYDRINRDIDRLLAEQRRRRTMAERLPLAPAPPPTWWQRIHTIICQWF